MRIRGFGNCKESLIECINGVMDDYSVWRDSNPSVIVLQMDTALSEAVYTYEGSLKGYYTYVLTIGYEDAADEAE